MPGSSSSWWRAAASSRRSRRSRTAARGRSASACATDGPFIEAGENDNLIVQRLTSDPNAYGIFGYSFLYENQDQLKPVEIEGVAPNSDTIESGEYGVSRPLFIYVKNDHRGVIPNLQEFLEEYRRATMPWARAAISPSVA